MEELQLFGEPLHRGPVVDVSVCVWRQVFVTCGASDRTLRLWNYSDGKQELIKTFDTPLVAVSIHPTG
jgi:WD40 repeat protein